MNRMRNGYVRLTMALVCAGLTSVSQAEDLVIQSFDSTGLLTFNEITTATVYQVQWANAPTGGWHSGSPGVTGIVARGWGQNVVTVGVAQAVCFYRVAASVTNAPAPTGDYIVVDLSGGANATSYPVAYYRTLGDVPGGAANEAYKTTSLLMRLISNGVFTMGSPVGELGVYANETQHQVTLTRNFYIGVYEVTQKQWEQVMGDWPGYYNNASWRDARPVEQVSYDDIRGSSAGADWPVSNGVDAASFMGRLRMRTGQTFDLPTESQWEYACRAGTSTALNSGYNITNVNSDAHLADLGRYWYNGGSGYTQNGDTSVGTASAGQYLPNAWGLYDMHGNVWEWCLDWYGSYPDAVSDPAGAATGSGRVVRGGSWFNFADHCRSAGRVSSTPDTRVDYVGLRAVMPAGQ